MFSNIGRRSVVFELMKLLPILALAFYIAFIPHMNYPFPVHVDEWVHMVYSQAILEAGSTTFIDPFSGNGIVDATTNLETGYHLLLGMIHTVTGISWLTIFRFFPSVVFIATVLSVYVLTKKEGFGWEAALFTCLIPTSVGILGPAFTVPVALGLLFIPLSLLLAFNLKKWPTYLLIFIFTCLLLLIHPPSAIILCIILIPYILFNLRGDFKHSLSITMALVIPIAALSAFLTFERLLLEVSLLFTAEPLPQYVYIPSIIQSYGYLPIAFAFLGIIMLVIRGGKNDLSLVFSLLLLLLMLVVSYRFHYGSSILYWRGLMFMMLMLSIIAGAGLAWVRAIKLPSQFISKSKTLPKWNVGNILCLVLIVATLVLSIPDRQNTPYYHMIDEEDYEAFVWIRDNIDKDYKRAVLDPWKATAFTAITRKYVYTRIHAFAKWRDEKAYEFLQAGCTDTTFLRNNEISIVYSQWHCTNPNLVEVRRNVYILRKVENSGSEANLDSPLLSLE